MGEIGLKLKTWEPVDYFQGELQFVEIHYRHHLKLVFVDEDNKEYTFTYKPVIEGAMPILTFRLVDEMVNGNLLGPLKEEREKNKGEDQLTCFYKVENSDILKWYDESFPSRDILHPNVEHHIYITSEYILEVLSEREPEITTRLKTLSL